MKPNSYRAVLMIGLLLALGACNLPRPQPQVISQQDVINTSAAQTVAALSTALADGKNPTLAAPTATPPTPSPTTESTDPGPEPSITPGPSATPQQGAGGATSDPNTTCNKAAFVKDVTIPDGSILPANSLFEKTWELKNTGTCTWNNTYNVVFSGSGNSLSGPAAAPLLASGEVKPGESVKVTVKLRAPGEKGEYQSRWLLRAPDGKTFGLGEKGTGTFYTQITVDDSYSFAALYCSAAWSTGAGALVCPGKESDAQGAVVQLENTSLENGSGSEGLALFTAAQPVSGGYIVGRYPAIMVPQGADFRALIGCRSGVAGCYVRFKLTAQVDNGLEQTLGEWNEGADGNMTQAIVDLDAYAGKPTAFNLYLYVNGTLEAAKGLWIDPRIVK
jgi:hypothetical protein